MEQKYTPLFINKYTQLVANKQSGANCSNKRPCYRKNKCEYCWNRWKKFQRLQLAKADRVNPWKYFLTIGIKQRNELSLSEAIELAKRCRKKFVSCFRDKGSFYCCLGIGNISSLAQGKKQPVTPHIHVLITSVEIEPLRKKLLSASLQFHFQEVYDFPKALGYILDQNARLLMAMDIRYLRVITACRGIATGRPKYNTQDKIEGVYG